MPIGGSLTGADIANGFLNDEDIGQATFVNFPANIGVVPDNECVDRPVTGIDVQGDHLLLTPNWNDASAHLIYSAQFTEDAGIMEIKACNPTNVDIPDGNTNFNLLVIDAQ